MTNKMIVLGVLTNQRPALPDPGELALAHPEHVILVCPQGVLERLGVIDTNSPAQTPRP